MELFQVFVLPQLHLLLTLYYLRDFFLQYSALLRRTTGAEFCARILCVSTPKVQKEGRVDKASHVPRGMLEFWLDPESVYFKEGKLDLSKEMVLFCAGGARSALATKSLKDMGFEKVSHIKGGFSLMKLTGFKVL